MAEEKRLSPMDQTTEFLLYTAPGGKVAVEVFLHNETIWLPQKRIAELFDTTAQNVGQHLKNIFADGELDENSVIKIFFATAVDGKNYKTKFYNLDAVISVGYRVNSSKATQFRIWATERLKEFIVKEFVLDDERLKNGRYFGKDYFRELLERVRSIRASERRIYQQITDIFAECSWDYDPRSEITQLQEPWHRLKASPEKLKSRIISYLPCMAFSMRFVSTSSRSSSSRVTMRECIVAILTGKMRRKDSHTSSHRLNIGLNAWFQLSFRSMIDL